MKVFRKFIIMMIMPSILFGLGIYYISNYFYDGPTIQKDEAIEIVTKHYIYGEGRSARLQRSESILSREGSTLYDAILELVETDGNVSGTGALDATEKLVLDSISRAKKGDKLNHDEVVELLKTLSDNSSSVDVVTYKLLSDANLFRADFLSNIKLSYNSLKQLAIRLHGKGFIDFSLDIIDSLIQMNGNVFVDPELLAWKGSALSKRALYESASLKKMELVKEGIEYLDKAVFDFPDYVVVRYIRSNTYEKLPSVFKKENMYKSDILNLISAYEDNLDLKLVLGYEDIDNQRKVNIEQLLSILKAASQKHKSDEEFQSKIEIFMAKF